MNPKVKKTILARYHDAKLREEFRVPGEPFRRPREIAHGNGTVVKSVSVVFGGISFVVEGFDDPVAAKNAILQQLRELGEEVGPSGEPDAAALQRALELIRARTTGEAEAPTAPGRTRRPSQPLDESTLQRMLDSANQQLSTPDAARRRESIKNQKAAVAATEAERRAGRGKKAKDPKSESFRKDLRDAMDAPEDGDDEPR